MHRAMFQLEPTNGRKKIINCDFLGHYSTCVPFPKQSSANCSRWNITASSLIKSCCYIFQSLSSVCFHATKKNSVIPRSLFSHTPTSWQVFNEADHTRLRPECVGRRDDWETICRTSVMFWGCISYYDVGTLTPVEGNMNSEKYISVLDDNLWPVIARHFHTGILRGKLACRLCM
jgi:hypothetical protein